MTQRLQIGFTRPAEGQEALLLPGLRVPAYSEEGTGWIDWTRYLGDEGLREQINSLYDRGLIVPAAQLVNPDGEADVPDEFPVLTAAELERQIHPRVLEIGTIPMYGFDEPADEDIPFGSAVLYYKYDLARSNIALAIKGKGTFAYATADDVTYTAQKPGEVGNEVTIQHEFVAQEDAVVVTVTGKAILLSIADTGDPIPEDAATAVNAHPVASTLVKAGFDSDTPLSAPIGPNNLGGGDDTTISTEL